MLSEVEAVDDEEVFVNTPKSVKKKKVNIPAFKGIGKDFVKPILCYVMLIF